MRNCRSTVRLNEDVIDKQLDVSGVVLEGDVVKALTLVQGHVQVLCRPFFPGHSAASQELRPWRLKDRPETGLKKAFSQLFLVKSV
jgi:hypothetical protein